MLTMFWLMFSLTALCCSTAAAICMLIALISLTRLLMPCSERAACSACSTLCMACSRLRCMKIGRAHV